MYVIIEKKPNTQFQTEYHIVNEIQMKQFIVDKNCEEAVSYEDFSNKYFGDELEAALNESQVDKQYQVVHVWLN